MAFGQGSRPVTVERLDAAGKVRQTETGEFGINLHRAGVNGTSSEGCQTVPPDQWDAFHALLTKELKAAGMKTFPYILIQGPIT
jgi:lysozyme